MQILKRLLILWLVVVPVCIAADQMKQSLEDLASSDAARYEKAKDYLTKHVGTARTELQDLAQNYDRPPVARLRAVMILGETKDTDSTEVLKSILFASREENARVRAEIVRSLAALRQQDSIVDYFNSNSEDSPIVRAQIALALGGKGDERAKLVLSRLAKAQDDEYVFRAAAIAIQETYGRLSSDRPKLKISLGTSAAASSEAPKTKAGTFLHEDETGGKFLHASNADLAVIAALKVQEKNPNKVISDTAEQILENLTELYGRKQVN